MYPASHKSTQVDGIIGNSVGFFVVVFFFRKELNFLFYFIYLVFAGWHLRSPDNTSHDTSNTSHDGGIFVPSFSPCDLQKNFAGQIGSVHNP